MILKSLKLSLAILILCTLSACSKSTFAAAGTVIAKDGNAALPIVVAAKASPQTKKLAQTLAAYLGKISGGKFDVKTGDGKIGLAVGKASDFPALNVAKKFDINASMKRGDYLLRSHTGGIYLLGASGLGAEHAVWDFLYRLGYRHFFPGKTWEIIPHHPDLSLSINTTQHPDYIVRRIWYDWHTWPKNEEDTRMWQEHNRATSDFKLRSGHAYGRIRRANKEAFEKHPEYLSHVNGKATNKLNIANPDLRKLVVNWAIRQFEKNPQMASISLEPSDGGGWGQSQAEKKLGSISDRVVLLANEVAKAVNARFGKKYGEKYVGIYAYYTHSAPPTIKVNPHVVVSVATAFNHSGLSIDELMNRWKEKGAIIGVREYYALINRSRYYMPTYARASDLRYIEKSIPRYYRHGVRFMSAEAGDCWGPCGLGYYLANRLMWNVKADPKAIINDFFEKAFGSVQQPMRKFYALLDKNTNPYFGRGNIGQMFQLLKTARQKTDDPKILARINDLVLYTHYCDLMWQYGYAPRGSRGKPKTLEALIKFAYRSRHTHMVHSIGLYRWMQRLHGKDIPKDAQWDVPEDKNPWKSSKPFSDTDLQRFIAEGIKRYPVIHVQAKKWSDNLVPATPLKLTSEKPGSIHVFFRDNIFYTWVRPDQLTISLKVTTGISAASNHDTEIQLFKGGAPGTTSQKPVDTAAVLRDKKEHTVTLHAKTAGLHRIQVSDDGSRTHMEWPSTLPMTLNPEEVSLKPHYTLYFYVPQGTKYVGGFSAGTGALCDPSGKRVAHFQQWTKFKFPVAAGQDGKLWQLRSASYRITLLTVPPYLARSAQQLLLPKEVVEADK